MSIAALILAAGASSRMGRPKALLSYRGMTFVENIINATREAAIPNIVAAIAKNDDKIRVLLELSGVRVVYNAGPMAAGPLGSIRAGLVEIINQQVEYAMIWPVDYPHVRSTTISALKEAAEQGTHSIVIPTYEAKGGHPVLFARSVFIELMAAPEDQGARFVVKRVPERVRYLPVDDIAVLQDIDTPEDYERLISSTKSLL